MERNSFALDESHSFLDTSNSTIFPNYILTKDSNDNLAFNHQNCKTASTEALIQINQMLFGENIDENINVFPEDSALKAVEKSFYDILRENYPPSPNHELSFSNLSNRNPKYANQYFLQNENLPMVQFRRGMEEGMKFLPSISNNSSLIHLPGNKPRFSSKTRKCRDLVGSKLQEEKDEEWDYVRSKGKRHANCEELYPFEGRNCKISVHYFKDPVGEIFSKMLLLHGDNYKREVIRLREIMKKERKHDSNKEICDVSVDLRSLLIHCSQAISTNDHKMANQLIKHIKKHSSLDGDGIQRMAHIFAIGLEARLAGTVDEFYNQIVDTRANHADILNGYHIVQLASPFLTVAEYFAHFTILNAIDVASKLHIIHFGIDFGYQWPRLMQALSERKDMLSPRLRITGIDVPELGFHNMEQIEDVGQRLAAYARSFGISFEYRAIVTKLEEICIEDVNIEKDELVIVICFYRMENLGEEMDMMNSPKNQVLNIIRQINPNIFIQGIVNVSFSGALFAPRFKQAIQHYSALFDLLDTNVPRENKARKFVENYFWAREAINLIACEGTKRTQRSETYKQWHARNLRVGFEQLPLDHFVVGKIKEMGNIHNKSFFVEGDNEWLLLGWKGRTIKAVSTWRPKQL